MSYEKFAGKGFRAVYNLARLQMAINIVLFLLILLLAFVLYDMKEKVVLVIRGYSSLLIVNKKLVDISSKTTNVLENMKSNLRMLELYQEQIIARSPELYKQFKDMSKSVRKDLLGPLEKELEELRKNRGVKGKGLQIELDRSGEYPI